MAQHISPYHAPNFYADSLAKGRHRDIVGGRWDETGRAQMALLLDEGLLPDHHLLDIGAGSLRLGCKAVPYLDPGHYWATDLSGALMRQGHAVELADPTRLPADHLIEDASFDFPRIPPPLTPPHRPSLLSHPPPPRQITWSKPPVSIPPPSPPPPPPPSPLRSFPTGPQGGWRG